MEGAGCLPGKHCDEVTRKQGRLEKMNGAILPVQSCIGWAFPNGLLSKDVKQAMGTSEHLMHLAKHFGELLENGKPKKVVIYLTKPRGAAQPHGTHPTLRTVNVVSAVLCTAQRGNWTAAGKDRQGRGSTARRATENSPSAFRKQMLSS